MFPLLACLPLTSPLAVCSCKATWLCVSRRFATVVLLSEAAVAELVILMRSQRSVMWLCIVQAKVSEKDSCEALSFEDALCSLRL